MHKIMAIAGVVLTSTLFAASARAEEATPAASDGDEKKFGIGGDLQFELPLGDFAKSTGPQIGPLVRFGYRVIPPLELTGRIGYLFGIGKTPDGAAGSDLSVSVSNIPVWVGARYFFMDAPAGFYGAAEIGFNFLSAHVSAGGSSASNGVTREGFNLGAGYVISKELPIDIRGQFSLFNLLGKETGETAFIAIGLSVGYTYQF